MRDELAERFHAQLDRPVRELSTGNRQKIGLIQAFMHEPELVILDEPIAGLDPLVQQSFHDLLREVTAEGRTVFLSSHTLSEVEQVAHRIAILRRGRLVVVDTVDASPRSRGAASRDRVRRDRHPSAALRSRSGRARCSRRRKPRVVVSFEGTADPLVKALSEYDVRSIRSRDADLEEIFLRYYRDEDAP